jgi:DNA-binding NarL/FixJ family response regulator
VLTTSTAEPDIARAYELGANSFISKPAAFDLLVNTMKSIGQYWFNIVVLPVKP